MKKPVRDLSERQFIAAAQRAGFSAESLGYWRLATPHTGVSVYRFNAGHRRRDQLAYLHESQAAMDRITERRIK